MSTSRVGLAVALLTGISLAPSLAQAQQTPGVHAGTWRYSSVVQAGGQSQDLGVRTITIARNTTDHEDTWLVVMAMQFQGQALTDSVVMRSTNLAPVSRHTVTTDSDLLLATDDTMAHGLLTGGHQLVPLNIRLGQRSFLNYYSLRASLAALPLARGWAGEASVLELGRNPVFSPITLTVAGEEHISTGAGAFDCWRVAVKGTGIDETYWVAKDTHDIIRTREPIGGQGAMLQLDLLSTASK
ncbi:MAG TPA: hypothetical protein VN607_08035 [Gemmatimonadaceae bacterium]|nr:hypothetical protein [Gemmatimonadaceae bacterium]